MTSVTPQTSFDDICLPRTLAFENQKLFTETQLNWQIKARHKNGLQESGAVLKVSGKIYLNKSKYFNWFMQQKAT